MDLTAILLRVAAKRPHVLVVPVPGATDVRLALEAALSRRGWPVATGPADADVLAVAGSPGPELAAVIDTVWEQVPAPRARVEVSAPADVDERLGAAAALLADVAHQRSAPCAPEPQHAGHTPGRQGGRSHHASELGDHREHEDHAGHGERVDMGDHSGHGDHAHPGPQPEPAVHVSHGGDVEHGGHAEHGSHAESAENGDSGDHRDSDGHDEQSDHADHIGHRQHGGQEEHAEHGDHSAPTDHIGHGQHGGHEEHAEHGDHEAPEDHSDQGAESSGHAGHGGGHHDHHGHGGGMVAGLPMAELGADRDGLTLDRLHVPLGPVLPDWPAGLVVRVTLQGDVIQEASAEVLDAGQARPPEWPSPVARELDGLARFLGVAGWPSAAGQARRLRDVVLAGGRVEAEAAALLRRIRRSRTLRWLIRGIPAGSTDLAALLAARLAAIEAALPTDRRPGAVEPARISPEPQQGWRSCSWAQSSRRPG